MRYSLLLLWDKMCADGAVPIQHQLDTPLLQNVWYQKSETETQKNCRTIRSSCNETRDTFSTSWKNTTFSCGKIWCNLCLISLILCTIVTYKYNKIGIGGLLATPPFCRHILLDNFLEQKTLYFESLQTLLTPCTTFKNDSKSLILQCISGSCIWIFAPKYISWQNKCHKYSNEIFWNYFQNTMKSRNSNNMFFTYRKKWANFKSITGFTFSNT